MQPPWHCLPALPSIEGTALCHSPWHRERETEVIEEEGMSLNAPLTPQNEIDRLAEVIAPSTIFFGRKYCYRQIGDSISGRRWGSRLWSKGCVCPLLLRLSPDALSLCPALSPLHTHSFSFCINPCFSLISPSLSLCFFHFLRPCYFITHNPHNISLPHPSILFSRASFSPFSSVDHFCEPEGENSITQ